MKRTPVKTQVCFEENAPESFDDADAALRRITAFIKEFRAAKPIIFTLDHHDSGSLYIGVGANDGVFLSHTPDDGNPPYNTSINDVIPSSRGVIEYYLHGKHHTEIEKKHVIPTEMGLLAVEDFIRTCALSKAIRWNES